MEKEPAIVIDVVSDVVCPWCYLGKRYLERALESLPELSRSVRWRPFQLDPSIPREGLERESYMLAKFGNRERIDAAHERLRELGAAAGIPFDFSAIRIAPNTLDSHRVIRWAGTLSEDVQSRLVSRLFGLYFEEGANIGDHAVLSDAARHAGMDADSVMKLLATNAGRTEVEAEIAASNRMGITGVPCFLLEGRYVLTGAQPPETLADAVSKVAEAKAKGLLDQNEA
ncbi:DsbA family oxidoreductase [Chelativorans sp. Marseille-P2723]|uniref:DsbA family oxidoreductase n=1 Tax=Chelativorans sp. Marseille-P2723 TaxID=2709133 RepID=UPI00156ED24B|nr:DsbA family oxidoreductase [Chelativorans sp. Marseille-P2723]